MAHNAAYASSNDLAQRTVLDKEFKDRTDEIAQNQQYYWYQRGLALIIYKPFDKTTR